MTPDPDAPTLPFRLPPWGKLKIALECLAWTIILALYPCGVLIWQWLDDPFDKSIDWRALYQMARACAVPAAGAFILKYRAWLQAPPGTKLVQKTVSVESGGGETAKITVKTESTSVEPKP